jgi:hypothetical protein
LSAAVELRRLFPLITDMAEARQCARTIAGWKPLPTTARPVRRMRPSCESARRPIRNLFHEGAPPGVARRQQLRSAEAETNLVAS